jgi:putative nucleotidyltransferase with HDIG domain
MAIEQHLMTLVERMPAFPKSVQRVLELTRDVNVMPKAIVEVIEKDPVLTAGILKVINSAFYSLPSKVSGVGQAVVLLGINTVKNLAIRAAALGMIPATNSAGYDTGRFLLHSLGCAEIAKLLAQKFGDTDPAEAYIGGLLHDFGKILFTLYMPAPFRAALETSLAEKIDLQVAERELLGADHTTAGALLAQKWRFPESLVECIRCHHQAPPSGGLGRSLFLANQMVKVLAFGDSGNKWVTALPAGLAGTLGDDYESIARSLPDIARQLELVRSYAAAGGQG